MNTTLNVNYDPYAPGLLAIAFTVNGTAPDLSTGYTATMRIWRSGLPTTAAPDVTATSPGAIALGAAGSIILDLVVIHAALAAVSATNAVWTYDLVVTPTAGYSQKVCSGQLAEGVGADDDVDVTAPISVTWSGQVGGDLSGNLPNPTVDGLQGRTVASTAPTNGQVLTWNSTASQWEPQGAAGGVSDGDKGDIVVSSGGTVWTIDEEAVTGDKIAPQAVDNSHIANQTIASSKYGLLSVQTGAIANSAITTGKIAADAVTYDKIQNVTAARLLGRMPGTAGDVQEVQPGSFLEFDSTGGTDKLTLKDGLRGDVSLAKGGETYTVEKIQGHKVQTGTPTAGDVLSYHGASAEWQHHSLAQAGIAAEVHAHGNLTSDGKVGSTAGLVIVTGTAGAVQALADGSAGTYLQTNGAGTLSWASVATGSTTTVTEYTYTTSGTYTKPAGLKYVVVEGVGGGGGGGAGSTTAGGNGGCAGLYTTVVIPEALITTSTLTVTIGTGGGAGVQGGDSEVTLASGGARLLYMPGGRAATNDMRNLAGGVTTNGFGAGQTAANATAARHGGYGPGGGGPGQTNTTGAGLAGGRPASHEFSGGNAQTGGGAAGGANGGGAGTSATVTVRGFGEGAGGGGANNAGAGGAGGNGTRGSGGGGGGRGSTAGGAGGSGGDGFIRIIEVVVT